MRTDLHRAKRGLSRKRCKRCQKTFLRHEVLDVENERGAVFWVCRRCFGRMPGEEDIANSKVYKIGGSMGGDVTLDAIGSGLEEVQKAVWENI